MEQTSSTVGQQSVKDWMLSIVARFIESVDKVQIAQELIKELESQDKSHAAINAYFTRIRRQLVAKGVNDLDSKLIKRSQEEIKKYQEDRVLKQTIKNKQGLEVIQYFNTANKLRQRIDSIDISKQPTIDDLIDVMVLFCMRVVEIHILKNVSKHISLKKDQNMSLFIQSIVQPHFTETRRQLKTLGMSCELANQLILRPREDVIKAINYQIEQRNKNIDIGLSMQADFMLQSFQKRILEIEFYNKPTLQNLTDLIVCFSMRQNEVLTLRFDPITKQITGYSKSKDNSIGRVARIPFGEQHYDLISRTLKWLQSHDQFVESQMRTSNSKLSQYVKDKYKIIPSSLRKYGQDLAVQYAKPINTAQEMRINQEATRHRPSTSTDLNYAIVNRSRNYSEQPIQTQQIQLWPIQEQEVEQQITINNLPIKVLGFRMKKKRNTIYYVKTINKKTYEISMNKNLNNIESTIRTFMNKKGINI